MIFTLTSATEILEDSGIAWPNPGMWYHPPHQLYGIQSPSKTEAINPDVHGHSPCYPDKRKDVAGGLASQNQPFSSQGYIPPIRPISHGLPLDDRYLSLTPLLPDPFIDNERHPKNKDKIGHLSSEDQSMPDCSGSITPTSSHNFSSHTVGPTSCSPPPEESQFEELMAAYSPHREAVSGSFASADTRVSSKSKTPLVQPKTSTTVEARALSYSHRQSHPASVNIRDSPSLLDCRSSDEISQPHSKEFAAAPVGPFEIQKSPFKDTMGRKEGRVGDFEISAGEQKVSCKRSNGIYEQENNRDSEDKSNRIGDAKRKRGSRISATTSTLKTESNTSPSPSRKFSKTEGRDLFDSDDGDDILIRRDIRSPLLMLENIQ